MAKKKITDLQLRGSVTEELNIPSDDGIQTYRVTAAQLQSFVIADEVITTPKIAPNAVNIGKLAQDVLDFLVPVGTVLPFAGSIAPAGFLLITGGAATNISRAEYSRLFGVIGTTFGAGDGSTTFGLPTLKGIGIRFNGSQTYGGITYNATLGQKRNDAIQNIVGSIGVGGIGSQPIAMKNANGAFGYIDSGAIMTRSENTGNYPRGISFDASRAVRTDSETHGADIALNAIIKF